MSIALPDFFKAITQLFLLEELLYALGELAVVSRNSEDNRYVIACELVQLFKELAERIVIASADAEESSDSGSGDDGLDF